MARDWELCFFNIASGKRALSGARRLVFTVNKRNAKAIAVYERKWLCNVRSVITDIGGGFVMDDYVMEKGLTALCAETPNSNSRADCKSGESGNLFAGVTAAPAAQSRSAGFQTCCIADFQIGWALDVLRRAGLETGDTADLEVCATVLRQTPSSQITAGVARYLRQWCGNCFL